MKLFIQVILLKGLNQKSNKQEIKRKKKIRKRKGKSIGALSAFCK